MKTAPLLAIAAALIAQSAAAADTFTIDPIHSWTSFEAPHQRISTLLGRFIKSEGTVGLDRAAKTGTVDVSIDAASIDIGIPRLSEVLRGKDFFNVEQFPKITYKGTSMTFNGDTPATVEGQMTLLGVTHPLSLTITSFKCITHPMLKREYCGVGAVGNFKRSDYGMTRYADSQGDDIKLMINVEAVRN